jgi:hypothetical protein
VEEIAIEAVETGLARKDNQFVEEAVKIAKNSTRDHAGILPKIAIKLASNGLHGRSRDLLEQAWEMETSQRNVSQYILIPIAAAMAKIGYLKRAREMAESTGRSHEVALALSAILLADHEGLKPSSSRTD